jgi:ankyrin repeat protein
MNIFPFRILLSAALLVSVACKKESPVPAAPTVDPRLLFAAIEKRDDPTARRLIDAGVDINARQAVTAYTPYVVAAKQCMTPLVRLLDERKADLTIEVGSANTVERSAFLNAAMAGCVDTLRYFIEEKKRDINTRHHVWNETALHKAVQSRNATLARYLIGRGIDRAITDNNGRTALDLAKEVGATELIELIEEKAKTP